MFKIDMSKPCAYAVQESETYYALHFQDNQERVIGGTNKAALERYARKEGYRIANYLGYPKYQKTKSILSHGL